MTELLAPAACARNRFSPAQRLVVFFGVSLALKYGLRLTTMAPAPQVLLLVTVATALAWGLWSAGPANRRLMCGLTAMLWIAAALKLALR